MILYSSLAFCMLRDIVEYFYSILSPTYVIMYVGDKSEGRKFLESQIIYKM